MTSSSTPSDQLGMPSFTPINRPTNIASPPEAMYAPNCDAKRSDGSVAAVKATKEIELPEACYTSEESDSLHNRPENSMSLDESESASSSSLTGDSDFSSIPPPSYSMRELCGGDIPEVAEESFLFTDNNIKLPAMGELGEWDHHLYLCACRPKLGCQIRTTHTDRLMQSSYALGRKIASDKFGRNKKETNQILEEDWVRWCRKCYQQKRYDAVKNGLWWQDQANVVRAQLERNEEKKAGWRYTIGLQKVAADQYKKFNEECLIRRNILGMTENDAFVDAAKETARQEKDSLDKKKSKNKRKSKNDDDDINFEYGELEDLIRRPLAYFDALRNFSKSIQPVSREAVEQRLEYLEERCRNSHHGERLMVLPPVEFLPEIYEDLMALYYERKKFVQKAKGDNAPCFCFEEDHEWKKCGWRSHSREWRKVQETEWAAEREVAENAAAAGEALLLLAGAAFTARESSPTENLEQRAAQGEESPRAQRKRNTHPRAKANDLPKTPKQPLKRKRSSAEDELSDSPRTPKGPRITRSSR
ncbi:hypothetical protein LTR28_006752 [Elasticomyces elasticus]|nr:hypothetical protein LTR28_006752 [Elasticomyces elasticus]